MMRKSILLGLLLVGSYACMDAAEVPEFELVSWHQVPKVRYKGDVYLVIGRNFEKMRREDDPKMKKQKTPSEIRDYLFEEIQRRRGQQGAGAQRR